MIKGAEYEAELESSWEAGLAASEADTSEETESKEVEESAEPAEDTTEEAEEPEETEEAEESAESEPDEDDGDVEEKPEEEATKDKEEPAQEVDKLEQLEALAKELGFEFNGEKVQNAHFVKLRQQAKVQRDKLEAKAQERIQQIEDAKNQLEARYKPFEEVRAAAELGDFDGLAKALGHGSFQQMAMAHVNGSTQEGAQRLKIQREMQELKAQQESYAKRVQEQQTQAQQAQAREQYTGVVAQTLGQYKETQSWAQNPALLEMVVDVQTKSAGLNGQPTMTIEQAAQNILAEAQKQRDTLGALLGTSTTGGEEASGQASPKTTEKKKKTKTVSQRGRVEAGNNASDEDFDHDAWLQKSVARMKKAIES